MKSARILVVFGFLAVGPMAVMLACGESTSSSSGGAPTATGTTTTAPTGSSTATSEPTSQPTAQPTSTSPAVDAGKYCDLGVARGDALQGQATLFDKQGNALPSGHYRIRYVDGCMIYGGGQPFTTHAYEPGADAAAYATWYTVSSDGGATSFESVKLPGIWIFGPDASATDASFPYESCVAQSVAWPPTEFEYDAGRKLGVQLNDSPLADNQIGPDGGSPAWRLEVWSPSGACP